MTERSLSGLEEGEKNTIIGTPAFFHEPKSVLAKKNIWDKWRSLSVIIVPYINTLNVMRFVFYKTQMFRGT